MAQLISATATSRDLNKTYDRYVALINIYITSYTLHIALVFFAFFSHSHILFYNDKNEIFFFLLSIGKVSYNSGKLSLLWKNSNLSQRNLVTQPILWSVKRLKRYGHHSRKFDTKYFSGWLFLHVFFHNIDALEYII